MPLRTHLDVLQESAAQYANSAAFRLLGPLSPSGTITKHPNADNDTQIEEWTDIMFSQFQSDVERYAKYWSNVLASDGVPKRHVVGLW